MKNKKYEKINYLVIHSDLNREQRRKKYVKELQEWKIERDKIVDANGIMKDVKPTMAKGKNKPFIKEGDIIGKSAAHAAHRNNKTKRA